MPENEIKHLKEVSGKFRRIKGKIKLLGLLKKAQEEYDNNNYANCAKICLEAVKINPKNPAALRGLGCAAQSSGNYNLAIKYYIQALKFSEHKEIEYTLLGTVYYTKGDLDKAVKYYNLAIDVNENYDLAYEGRNQTMLEAHLKIADLQDRLIQKEMF